MLHKILNTIDSQVSFTEAKAHCDIPCGIYDPFLAQYSVLTAIRMEDQIAELLEGDMTPAKQAKFSRLVTEKEMHLGNAKEEIRIIWGDFFKQPVFDKYPQTHELTHKIMMQASIAKQHLGRDHALDLLKSVNEFAEVFWGSKGVETYTAKSPYAVKEDVVYPKIG